MVSRREHSSTRAASRCNGLAAQLSPCTHGRSCGHSPLGTAHRAAAASASEAARLTPGLDSPSTDAMRPCCMSPFACILVLLCHICHLTPSSACRPSMLLELLVRSLGPAACALTCTSCQRAHTKVLATQTPCGRHLWKAKLYHLWFQAAPYARYALPELLCSKLTNLRNVVSTLKCLHAGGHGAVCEVRCKAYKPRQGRGPDIAQARLFRISVSASPTPGTQHVYILHCCPFLVLLANPAASLMRCIASSAAPGRQARFSSTRAWRPMPLEAWRLLSKRPQLVCGAHCLAKGSP